MELRDDLKVVFDFWYLMHGKDRVKTRLYVVRTFYKVVYLSCVIKIDEDISFNFKDTKMVDHILKISRPGVFDIRCLNLNTAKIVNMKIFCMDQRRYKSLYLIPMFIGTPCTLKVTKEIYLRDKSRYFYLSPVYVKC